MRIDTCETALERGKQMAYMCDKIRKITPAEASNLPEQHFLVKEFSGWRHIDVVWNREVYPEQYVDHASVLQNVRVSHDWCTPRSCNKVRIFHFNGIWLRLAPWWYMHMQPESAKECLMLEYRDVDKRHNHFGC